MEIIKNRKLQERRHFLARALNAENITIDEYHEEIVELEKQIQINLIEALEEAKNNIKLEIEAVKKVTKYDGDFKRAIANYLMKLLGEHLDNSDIKGIFRQGYKLTRYQ